MYVDFAENVTLHYEYGEKKINIHIIDVNEKNQLSEISMHLGLSLSLCMD